MIRLTLTFFASALVGFAFMGAQAQTLQHVDNHGSNMDQCATACAECMRACESCASHCAHMVASGDKEHLVTLGTCSDCGEICAAAAKIVSRQGPMAGTICEACAKACDTCCAACEKFPQDKHMNECAKACRDCAKACRNMLQHIGQESHHADK
jgi:hypothetical protein